MEARVKQLLENLKADGGLAKKVFSQETAEAARAVLRDAGFTFSPEEIIQARNIVIKDMKQKGKLSDEDLESVAGGEDIVENRLHGKIILNPELIDIIIPWD